MEIRNRLILKTEGEEAGWTQKEVAGVGSSHFSILADPGA